MKNRQLKKNFRKPVSNIKKAKTVLKRIPEGVSTIDEYENWFSAMAEEGLFLKWVSAKKARFTVGEPKQMKYGIDVSGEKTNTLRRIENRPKGLVYVTSTFNLYIYSYPVKPDMPDFYKDTAEQTEALENKLKEFKKRVLLFAAGIPLAVLAWVVFELVRSSLFLDMARNTYYFIDLAFILLLGKLIESNRRYKDIRKFSNSLRESGSIGRVVPWKKSRVKLRIGVVVYFSLMALAAYYLLIPAWRADKETTSVDYSTIPIVCFVDTEKDSMRVADPSDGSMGAYLPNYNWSLITPVRFDSWEFEYFTSKNQKDKNPYEVEIDTEVYKLSFAFMRNGFVSELAHEYTPTEAGYVNAGTYYTEVNNPDFDRLLIHKENDFREIVAAKGKGVMWLIYRGPASDETVIDSVAKKITLLSDYQLTGIGKDSKYNWVWRLY